MKINFFFVLLIVLLTAFLSSGCSEKSTVDPDKSSRISVLVTDESGNPISGAVVTTNPETSTITTDNDGIVIIEDIPVRSYSVIVNKSGSPEFKQFINLNVTNKADLYFIIIAKLMINIKDEVDRPIIGAALTTIPATQEVITDNNGTAFLENVPVQPYLFTVTPRNLPPVKRNVVLDENTLEYIDFIITSEPPVMQILEPPDDKVTTPFNVVFEGMGTDNEDGVLPDSVLVWYSNSDGKLGTGNKITVDELSRGNHIITLDGTDSDNKTGTTTISIAIVDYDPDSYFPLLENSTWRYRHTTPNFYIVTPDNVSEFWELKDLTISIDDENRRISTVYYDISIGIVIKHFRYTLVDYLETDNGNIYVTKTTEELREWKENEENNPYYLLNVNTSYTPNYLILKNITDPTSESHYESTVRAETEWSYKYYSIVSSVFRESINLTTTVDVGDMKYIQTDIRLFNALKISFNTTDSIKTWWLTRGLGLVSLEYNLSDSEQAAVLINSDMLEFYREPVVSKAAGYVPVQSAPASLQRLQLSRETGEGFMELRKILRGMLP